MCGVFVCLCVSACMHVSTCVGGQGKEKEVCVCWKLESKQKLAM